MRLSCVLARWLRMYWVKTKKKSKNKVTILRTRRCYYDTDQVETLQEHGVRSGRSK